MNWYILMKDGTRIVNFNLEDEFGIRQQIFMEFGEWAVLIIESLFPNSLVPRYLCLKANKSSL